ncbi:MAG TPA: hypothetical protein VMC62_04830 [Longilinea sp.]|nr:hypothetical protein [Longilinea sp.]
MKSRIEKAYRSAWFFPIVLLLVCLITYAYQVWGMGFYWDDWPVVYLARLNSAPAFWSYYSFDRPFSIWIYLLTFPVLGTNPLPWQLFTISLRWLSALGFWITLRGLWPRRSTEVGWIALLFVVYPGFSQQSISVAYSQHFICYALFTASLALMVWGLRKPRWFKLFTVLSVVAAILEMFTMEYFAGLELLRPLLIWILTREPGENRQTSVKRVFRYWLPYLLALIAFLVWRLVFYNHFVTTGDPNAPVILSELVSNPFSTLRSLAESILQDFLQINLFAWVDTISLDRIVLNATANLFSWFVGAAVALAFVYYFLHVESGDSDENAGDDHFVSQGVLIGLVGFFAGGMPVWVTGVQASAGTWSDRFSLAPMFGAIIMLVSLVSWLGKGKLQKMVLLGVIFGLAMSAQMQTVNKYRLNWDIQRSYYWQLAWRMPSLKPGTVLVSSQIPFSLVAEYSVAFADNIIYDAPAPTPVNVPYWFFSAFRHVGTSIPSLTDGMPIDYQLRSIDVASSTSQAVVVDWSTQASCVRVLGPDDTLTPGLSSDEIDLLTISNLNQIVTDPAQPVTLPADIFGAEPEHTWCYYYEKADLASQIGNWTQVVQLYQEAEQRGYTVNDAVELIPFIEGYAHTGDWDKALELTTTAGADASEPAPYLCSIWQTIDRTTPTSSEKLQVIQAVNQQLSCSSPAQ